jgi:hypothetical protein
MVVDVGGLDHGYTRCSVPWYQLLPSTNNVTLHCGLTDQIGRGRRCCGPSMELQKKNPGVFGFWTEDTGGVKPGSHENRADLKVTTGVVTVNAAVARAVRARLREERGDALAPRRLLGRVQLVRAFDIGQDALAVALLFVQSPAPWRRAARRPPAHVPTPTKDSIPKLR